LEIREGMSPINSENYAFRELWISDLWAYVSGDFEDGNGESHFMT